MADGSIGSIDGETGEISVEAEDIIVSGFVVEDHDIASGGKTVSLFAGGAHEGALAYAFEGDAGDYDLLLTLHDENDGTSTVDVYVNGVRVEAFILDQNDTPGVVTAENRVVLVIEGLELARDDLIEVRAAQGGTNGSASTSWILRQLTMRTRLRPSRRFQWKPKTSFNPDLKQKITILRRATQWFHC